MIPFKGAVRLLTLSTSLAAELTEATREHGVAIKPLVIEINGKLVSLDIRNDRPAAAIALPFCRDYGLLPSDCNVLVAHVEGQQREQWPSTAQTQSEAEVDNVMSGGVERAAMFEREESAPSAEDRSLAAPATAGLGGVDYSVRTGPHLAVTLANGQPSELQCYSGESPERATTRFCSKHRLSASDCSQARSAFFRMHGLAKPDASRVQVSVAVRGDVTPETGDQGQPWYSQWITAGVAKWLAVVLVLAAYVTQWRDEAHPAAVIN
jgi:hypothetical protein